MAEGGDNKNVPTTSDPKQGTFIKKAVSTDIITSSFTFHFRYVYILFVGRYYVSLRSFPFTFRCTFAS